MRVVLPIALFMLSHILYWEQVCAEERPDILLISIDTLRADHLSTYGYKRNTSPCIDLLAAQSAQFDDCITPIPITLPGHTSMLSGFHPSEHGVYTNGLQVPDNVVLISEILKETGYETFSAVTSGIIGNTSNLNQGFDQYLILDQGTKTERSNAPTEAYLHWQSNREQENPYFAFIHYIDVHDPYGGISPFINFFGEDKSDMQEFEIDNYTPKLMWEWYNYGKYLSDPKLKRFISKYDDGIIAVDHQIGKIINALVERGKFQNTLIILTSDHGEGLGDGKANFYHGDTVYQETLHVPLIIHFPDSEYAGVRSAYPATLMDLAPTILEVLSLGQNPPMPSGTPLVPVLSNPSIAQSERLRYSSSHSGVGQHFRRAITQNNFKQIRDEWNNGMSRWVLNMDVDLRDPDFLSVHVKSERIFNLNAVVSTGQRLIFIPMKTATDINYLPADWAEKDHESWHSLETPYLSRFVNKKEQQNLRLLRLELNAGQSSHFRCFFDSITVSAKSQESIIESFESADSPKWIYVPDKVDSKTYKFSVHHNEITSEEWHDGKQSHFLELKYTQHPFAFPLFDLSADKNETKDIAPNHIGLSESLLEKLDEYYQNSIEIPLRERSDEAKEILRAMGYLE